MTIESGKLFPFCNVSLFSDHFLSKRLPAESSLWASAKTPAQSVFDKILLLHKKFTARAYAMVRQVTEVNEAVTKAGGASVEKDK